MHKMIANVSGCDGTGKTTLSTKVSENLGGLYTHFDKPKDLEDGKKQYFDFIDKTEDNQLYICDRFHDGEWVYAPLYRGYTGNYMGELEGKIIEDHNYLFTYVTASLETIIERTRVRGEDFVKEEHFQVVLDNFRNNFLMEQKMPFTIIDTTTSPLENNIKMIEDDIEKINKIWGSIRTCTKCDECGGMNPKSLPRGNVRGKYMVVAQNPGGKGKSDKEYVTMWSEGPTSKFFIDTLKSAGIYLDCWFTNVVLSSTEDNKINNELANACKEHLEQQVELIQPETIICLGRESEKYVKRFIGSKYNDINIVHRAHPSYILRYKKDEIEEYKELFSVDSLK